MRRKNFGITGTNGQAFAIVGTFFHKSIICTVFGINRLLHSTRISHCRRTLSPGEVWTHKGCCHQQSCCQSLQSFSCGFALGVAFGDFRCHHIGVLCFAPDDFIDLIHVDTLL